MNLGCSLLIPALVSATGTANKDSHGQVSRRIRSHFQIHVADSPPVHDEDGSFKISNSTKSTSVGNHGVSLRNSDRTPPGPASQQEVMVQYESLCPDSVVFFKGMEKAYADEVLRNRFTFELIPYGNTKLPEDKKLDKTKPWGGRTCQHGEHECWGNAWQACTHAIVSDRSRTMQHTFCLMNLPKNGMPTEYWKDESWPCGDYKQCVVDRCDDGTLTPQEKAKLLTCVQEVRHSKSNMGSMEMDSHQKAAELWHIKHVPWIVVNGKHVDELDENKISLTAYLKGLPEAAPPSRKSEDLGARAQEQPDGASVYSHAEEQPDDTNVEESSQVHSQRSANGVHIPSATKKNSAAFDAPSQDLHQSGQEMAVWSVIMLLGATSVMCCMYVRNKGWQPSQ